MERYKHTLRDLVAAATAGGATPFDVVSIGLTTSTAAGVMVQHYGDMVFWSTAEQPTLALVDFLRFWQIHSALWVPQYTKMYTAITAVYDPLENYNRTDTKNGSTTNAAYTDTDTYTPGTSTQTESTRGTYERSEQASTYDASVKDVSKSTEGHAAGQSDTTVVSYLDVNGEPGKDTTAKAHGAHTDTYGETLTSHGNIGTMSTQDMMQQELTVRQYNIWLDFIGLFVRTTCNTDFDLLGGCTL